MMPSDASPCEPDWVNQAPLRALIGSGRGARAALLLPMRPASSAAARERRSAYFRLIGIAIGRSGDPVAPRNFSADPMNKNSYT
jgi:hypothetical protein